MKNIFTKNVASTTPWNKSVAPYSVLTALWATVLAQGAVDAVVNRRKTLAELLFEFLAYLSLGKVND